MSYYAITVTYSGPGKYHVRWDRTAMRVRIDDTLPQDERRRAAALAMIEKHGTRRHKAAQLVEGELPNNVSVFVLSWP